MLLPVIEMFSVNSSFLLARAWSITGGARQLLSDDLRLLLLPAREDVPSLVLTGPTLLAQVGWVVTSGPSPAVTARLLLPDRINGLWRRTERPIYYASVRSRTHW